MSSKNRRVSNLELAMMLGSLNPNSTTRPCTQCNAEVPKTQVLLTCEKCREKKKRQKERRKERDMAVAEGRSMDPSQGFSSAPLQAVIAKQEQETAARRAATRKAGGSKSSSEAAASSSSSSLGMGMGLVLQAILNEHEKAAKPAPKKKTTKKAAAGRAEESVDLLTSLLLFEMAASKAGSSSQAGPSSATARGTKRKLQDMESYEPGRVYDAETSRKRMRGDMPMPPLEPIPQAGGSNSAKQTDKKSVPNKLAVSKSAGQSTSKQPLPLTTQSSNLPPPTKTNSGAKAPKVQANLASWFKPSVKPSA
ncbi:hypothetical protein C8R45DRAFT_997300 [Mycena sanguinolenta]|nr:hypothetical protein C8R45DRAFT_997300 [Mycena sanguinolenta]